MYDIVIIGSGPGGYVCAIRAAQLGLKTAVVEKDPTLGGTCLNVGCIPSKALLESSEFFQMTNHDAKAHGVDVTGVRLNLGQMMSRKEKIVKDLTGGIAFLFKKNKIDAIRGKGSIKAPGIVIVEDEKGQKKEVATKSIILATGSVPSDLPFLKFDEKRIVSSTGALSLNSVPTDLVVVGGGVIGLELGSVWSRLGAKVTVLEYASSICATMDQQVIGVLKKAMEKMGVKFVTDAQVKAGEVKGSKVTLTYLDKKENAEKKITADVVLVSAGRKPFSEGLGLEAAGVKKNDRGYVQVDEHFQTSVPGIYAIGDLIPGPMLAHKAEEEGVAVAEILAGQHGHVNYATVPNVIYTFPEVASVGLTEEEVKQKGIAYRVGTFPFLANGRAKALGQTEGMVKIIADEKTDRILGGHIVGPRASELLGEIVIAMEFGGSSEDLARSFHAHPTLNEVVREAALAVDKRMRQM